MAYNPPLRNTAWATRVSLDSYTSAGRAQVNPTLVIGDVKIDKDGGGLNNITTLPVVSPSGSQLVLVTLSASEMDADIVTIVFRDQTTPTPEWCDLTLAIETTAS